MTQPWRGAELAARIQQADPDAVERWTDLCVWVRPEHLYRVAETLKNQPDLDFALLVSVTGVDYIDHFEVVYHLTSLHHNRSTVIKTLVYGRENPSVPSLVSLWRGADLQEREVYDLVGITFSGHPNLKRIMLWEGFTGHPLRKDFV